MSRKAPLRDFATYVATALLVVVTVSMGSRSAFAAAFQTVFCEGSITNSSDPTVPAGPLFSVGAVTIKSANADCATTSTAVTQVINATCNGQTPCVTTMTETNSVPLSTKGCPSDGNTPGITTSLITASSNPDLVGCRMTAIADTFSSKGGAFTLIITPQTGSSCKAAGTTGLTACTSFAQ